MSQALRPTLLGVAVLVVVASTPSGVQACLACDNTAQFAICEPVSRTAASQCEIVFRTNPFTGGLESQCTAQGYCEYVRVTPPPPPVPGDLVADGGPPRVEIARPGED